MNGQRDDPRFFRIANLREYQNYKDRRPPWIKLHQKTLDSYEHSALPDETKWALAVLWLLASRSENRLPWDPAWLQKSGHLQHPPNLDLLLSAGFIELCEDGLRGASTALATRKQSANPETETETEAETEKDGRAAEKNPPPLALVPGKAKDPEREAAAQRLFDAWVRLCQKKRAKYAPDRRAKILARLKDGFTEADLLHAIEACAASDFHMGRHPDTLGKPVNDLSAHVLPSRRKVEWWLERWDLARTTAPAGAPTAILDGPPCPSCGGSLDPKGWCRQGGGYPHGSTGHATTRIEFDEEVHG